MVLADMSGMARQTPQVYCLYLGRNSYAGPLIARALQRQISAQGVACTTVTRTPRQLARLLWLCWQSWFRPELVLVSVMVSPFLVPFSLLVRRRCWVHVVHDVVPHPGWFDRVVGYIDRFLGRGAATVLAVSEDGLQHAAGLYGHRTTLRYLPLPLESDNLGDPVKPPELKKLDLPFALLFGRMESYKGFAEFFAAAAERWDLDRIGLVVAGAGAAGLPIPAGFRSSVYVVDRYISEQEVDWFDHHALVVLLPYTSASQSGVVERLDRGPSVPVGYNVSGLGEQLRSIDPLCAVEPGDAAGLIDAVECLAVDAGLLERCRAAKHRRGVARDEAIGAAVKQWLFPSS